MGKVRKGRRKLHVPCVKIDKDEKASSNDIVGNVLETSKPQDFSKTSENLFEGIDIDVYKLKVNIEDDGMSVRSSKSIAKSIKKDTQGKLVPKGKRRKLRHAIFIQKIDSIYKNIAHSDIKSENEVESLGGSRCTMKHNEFERVKAPKKIKPIKKAKKRQKEMLSNIEVFKKAISNLKAKENSLEEVCTAVKEKVIKGVL